MPAAAVVGAAVVGAGASIYSGSQAAKAQKKAAQTASDTELKMFEQNRADLAPYREAGYGALGKLSSLYGVQPTDADGKPVGGTVANSFGYGDTEGFKASPGYEFRLNEGIKAAERSAAARGSLASGGTLKAIQRYGEGLAASEFDTYANRLASLAGVGQTATNTTAALGQQTAGNVAQNQIAAGNARASSYANTGAAINNGVTNLASAYLYQQGGGFGAPKLPYDTTGF